MLSNAGAENRGRVELDEGRVHSTATWTLEVWRQARDQERKLYRVGPSCETWPNSLTENPY